MVFARFVELGRVVVIKKGAFASKLAVIVEVIDHNRVLVDGPQAITGVPRHVVNLNTITLTSLKVNNVTRGLTHKKLCVKFNTDAILKRFNKTATGKAIEKRILREKMTDFDKFQVNLINKKINAAASFPHDVWKLIRREPQTAEQMWKALPDFVKGDSKTLVVRDGSGSMTCTIPNSTTTALDVASSLCVYFSERMTGEFKNKFITFSARPRLVELGDNTSLKDKMWLLERYDECSNTNIEATFQLVLDTAVNNNLKQEELPTSLLIVSDMEFDYATSGRADDKLFTTIRKKWEAAGYQLPRLVFWNVNSRTGAIPMTQNKNGVILISGFSAALCNMVLSEETDPYLALVKVLNTDRYNPVIDVIKDNLSTL